MSSTEKKYKKRYVFFCVLINLIIALLIFVPFIIQGDGLFSLGDDFDAQELPFNIFANREIKEGDIFFNWGIDIGSDFISSFSFYNLGSPFFWLTLLFKPETFPWLVGWIYVLKYTVAGLFSFLWMRRHSSEGSALMGSVLYAFSGFQAMNMIFYHFHDVVALFPLLMIGFDKLTEERRKGVFAVTVAINALVNWNLFIGEVVFLIIYYICTCEAVTGLIRGKESRKKVSVQVGSLLLEGTLGVGMASVLFIPTVYAMLGHTRVKETMALSAALTWNAEDTLRNLKGLLFPAEAMNNNSIMRVIDWNSVSAYLPMIGIIFCITWVILNKGKKDSLSRMLVICFILSMTPVTNSVFTLFNKELYRRWYYMPILLMALASAKVVDKLKENDKKAHDIALRSGIFITVLSSLYLLAMGLWKWNYNEDEAILNVENWTHIAIIALAGSIITIFIILLSQKKKRNPLYLLTFGICIFAWVNHGITILEYRERAEFTSQEIYNKLVVLPGNIQSNILPYRYAIVDHGGYINLNMANSLTSIDSFTSVVDPGITEFYDALGVGRKVMSENGPIGTDRLLSARYFVLTHPELTSFRDEEPVYEFESDGTTLYIFEDKLALSVGQGYDSYITQTEFECIPFEMRAIVMLHDLVIDDEDEEKVSEVLTHTDVFDYFSRNEAAFRNRLDNMSFGEYRETLAWLEKAATEELISRAEFYEFQTHNDVWNQEQDVIKREDSRSFRVTQTGFSFRFKASKDEYVYLSVPYSERWSAGVNGEKVEILNINGLMAVPVSEGLSTISFVYDTSIDRIAVVISIICTAIVVLILVADLILRKLRPGRKTGSKENING